jgi:hypothetical protein
MSEGTIPWTKQPDEPDRWFDRFDRHARMLGHEYTIKSAYWLYLTANPQEREKDAFDIWKDMAVKYNWESRAKAWADFDKETTFRKWQKRRMQLLDQDWDTGEALRRSADNMLNRFEELVETSVMEETDPETGVITRTVILKPNFTIGDVSRVAKIGSELQRLGVGEPTSISAQAQAGVGVYLPAIGSANKKTEEANGQGQGSNVEASTEDTRVELGEIRQDGDPDGNVNSDESD